MLSTLEFARQPFTDFLNNRDETLAKAVALSQKLKSELSYFGDIKQSLANSLNVSINQIHFYGSRVIGIANAESDLDIYIEMNGSFYEGLSKEHQQQSLEDFKGKIQLNKDWRVDIAIYDATVPVLHLDYIPKNIKCEITLCNGLGVVNSKLLAHLYAIQPKAVKFYHFIRLWLSCTEVEFKGYQLALLVLFFLQTRNFVPAMKKVQKNLIIKKVKGWPIQFHENKSSQAYYLNPWVHFKKAVLRFFEYYGGFNYEANIIFTNLGIVVDKTSFAKRKSLKKYPKEKENFQMGTPMALAGPLSFDYNVAQDVSAKNLEKFKQLCLSSSALLLPMKKI